MMSLRLSIGGVVKKAAQHPVYTLYIWGLIMLGAVVLAFPPFLNYMEGSLTTGYKFTKELESDKANQLIRESFFGKDPERSGETVIVYAQDMQVDSPKFRNFTENVYREVMALGGGVVTEGISFYSMPNPYFVSKDKHSTVMNFQMAGTRDDADKNVDKLLEIVNRNDGDDGFQVMMTGDASLNKDSNKASEETLQKAEIVGLPIALIILLVVFGTVVAAIVPLVVAGLAIVSAIGISSVVGQLYTLNIFVVNMITMMGLAVGIDYSLFIISRYREERRHGFSKIDAIGKVGDTAIKAIFFSGLTVIISLLGLLLVPMNLFQSLAAGAIFVVFFTMLAVLTLLPALLALLGDKIDALKVPLLGKRKEKDGLFWNNLARITLKRSVISLILAGAILVLLALPAKDLKTGASGAEAFPRDLPAVKAFVFLKDNFDFAGHSSALVVMKGGANSRQLESKVTSLEKILESDQKSYGKPVVDRSVTGGVVLLTVPLAYEGSSTEATDKIKSLREDIVPQVFRDTDITVLITGIPAMNLDYFQLTDNYRNIVFIFVLSTSFILLMLVFRSIIVPLKAILLNLLSVFATYGVLVMVFVRGYGHGILGFTRVEVIDAWIPIFLFAILFGLSMDYHVFLLSRMKEHFMKTGDNTESVAFGVRTTGRIITGAALIMVAIFGGFASGGVVMFQQMGFGLAVAILLDATIVRSVMVPAGMRLLGKWNWWFPRFLEWLPRVDIGG